jgi:hypothetical protein
MIERGEQESLPFYQSPDAKSVGNMSFYNAIDFIHHVQLSSLFSLQEVRQMWGTILPDTLVWTEGRKSIDLKIDMFFYYW